MDFSTNPQKHTNLNKKHINRNFHHQYLMTDKYQFLQRSNIFMKSNMIKFITLNNAWTLATYS